MSGASRGMREAVARFQSERRRRGVGEADIRRGSPVLLPALAVFAAAAWCAVACEIPLVDADGTATTATVASAVLKALEGTR